jgi:hypothetical protein
LFSLGLVRAFPFVIATVFALSVGCSHRTDELKVNAPIAPEDVQDICALVRAATSEPISQISEVTTEAYIAGVTPRQTVSIAANGERHESTMYPCPDRVWVFTHPAKSFPLWLDIQKKEGKWTIVKTERMTYR